MSTGQLLRLGLLPSLSATAINESERRRPKLQVKDSGMDTSGDPIGALYRAILNGTMSTPQATAAQEPALPEVPRGPAQGSLGWFDSQIQKTDEGLDQTGSELANLLAQDPGPVPNYDPRNALTKNELLISGGAALLGSLLGARPQFTSGALDNYVGGKKALYDASYKNQLAQREAVVEGQERKRKSLEARLSMGQRRSDSLYRARSTAAETERKTADDLRDYELGMAKTPREKIRAELEFLKQEALGTGLNEAAAIQRALERLNAGSAQKLSAAELNVARTDALRWKVEQEVQMFPAKLQKLLAEGDLIGARKLESEARTKILNLTAKYFDKTKASEFAQIYGNLDLRRKEFDQRAYEFDKNYERLTSDSALKYASGFEEEIGGLEATQKAQLMIKDGIESQLKPKDGQLPLNADDLNTDLLYTKAAIEMTAMKLKNARARKAAAEQRYQVADPGYAPNAGQVGPPAPKAKKKSEEPVMRGNVNRSMKGSEPVVNATNSVGFEEGKVCTGKYDCSSFTQTYARTVGKKIPRTAIEQYRSLKPVPMEQIQPGDLVFFNTVGDADPADHAGVYLGGGRFRHASGGKKKGYRFKTSSLREPYYQSRFSGARRP